MAELGERERKLLEEPNFAFVGTIRPDGSPHVVPTWVHVDDGTVLLNTAEGRVWPENARREPRVTVTVADRENPYEFVQIRGRVVEDTHEGADEDADRLAQKYLGVDEYPFRQPGEQRVRIRVEPEHIFHLDPNAG